MECPGLPPQADCSNTPEKCKGPFNPVNLSRVALWKCTDGSPLDRSVLPEGNLFLPDTAPQEYISMRN